MDERRQRKQWTGAEIAHLLRRLLVDKEEMSQGCEELGCHPSQVYRWQKDLFDRGAELFERRRPQANGQGRTAQAQVAALEAQVRRKDAVLAELMEEHVRLKKTFGGA